MIRPWMLLAVMILVGAAFFSLAVYNKWSDDDAPQKEKKEKFRVEAAHKPSEKTHANAKAAEDKKGAKAAEDLAGPKSGVDAAPPKPSDSVEKPGAKNESRVESSPSPIARGQVPAPMLRRLEDELESIANRIDAIIEEIAASRSHDNGKKEGGVVEGFASFGGYHPGM